MWAETRDTTSRDNQLERYDASESGKVGDPSRPAHVVRVSRVTLRVLAEAVGQLVALSTLPLSTTSISAIAPRSIALFAIRISKTSAQLL